LTLFLSCPLLSIHKTNSFFSCKSIARFLTVLLTQSNREFSVFPPISRQLEPVLLPPLPRFFVLIPAPPPHSECSYDSLSKCVVDFFSSVAEEFNRPPRLFFFESFLGFGVHPSPFRVKAFNIRALKLTIPTNFFFLTGLFPSVFPTFTFSTFNPFPSFSEGPSYSSPISIPPVRFSGYPSPQVVCQLFTMPSPPFLKMKSTISRVLPLLERSP